ncbi:MAG: hypothetical protein M1830_002807, partial [Pleopsidium flavum]
DAEVRARLRDVQTAATNLTKKLLKNHIWQRGGFGLELVREDGLSLLRGRTNYGDSVEDEWLIVYLLRELSREFAGLWIKVVDTDGEFLLIEAANALPRWLNPEIANNRIWLHDGKLLLIPLQQPTTTAEKTVPISRPLNAKEAHHFINDNATKLIHSPRVESEAFYRLRNYPKQIDDNIHHAIITIPRKVAYILHDDAAYISPAVEAFYLRDPIALKPLQAKDVGGLIFPPEDLVTVSVKFTKVSYAQLKSQQFSAPPLWNDKLPMDQGSKDYAGAEMGMKATCGFEMLVSDPQNKDKRSVRELKLLLDDVRSGEERLPSDAEVAKWETREDDDKWLDINFEDFERELAGKAGKAPGTSNGKFGEKSTQENLRKMVERFEDFLNDDAAGAEGAEMMDAMDFDDDDDDESDVSSEGEDKAVSFDEKEFARMMREMMGMPADEEEDSPPGPQGVARIEHMDSDSEQGNEGKEIRKVMQRMEAELNEAGALNLDPAPQEIAATQTAIKGKKKKGSVASPVGEDEGKDSSDEEEVHIDFNLAKNLLESFKSQGGMAGPGGNLMGVMGMQLPRDADDTLP